MAHSRKHNQTAGIAADHLRAFIERVERLEAEKAALAEDIKEVFAQARGEGFDTKTMKQIIRLRKMEPAEREEYEALLDIYKAALGMLDGTPLGEAALRKLSGERPKQDEPEAETSESEVEDKTSAPAKSKKPEITLEEAREMARKAVAEGKAVTCNPFPARDPRRAAWDEEWCRCSGSDGLELPDAWRRTSKRATQENNDEDVEGKAA